LNGFQKSFHFNNDRVNRETKSRFNEETTNKGLWMGCLGWINLDEYEVFISLKYIELLYE